MEVQIHQQRKDVQMQCQVLKYSVPSFVVDVLVVDHPQWVAAQYPFP